MGQRLLVNVYEKGEDSKEIGKGGICSIYYHWSAYTTFSLMELENIAKAIQDVEENNDVKLDKLDRKELIQFLINALEKTGARIHPDDYDYMQKEYPDIKFSKEEVDRNLGLIAFSKETKHQQFLFAEDFASVFLKEREVSTNVFDFAEDEETLKDIIEVWEELPKEEIEKIVKDIEEIDRNPYKSSFEDIDECIDISQQLDRDDCWVKVNGFGYVRNI